MSEEGKPISAQPARQPASLFNNWMTQELRTDYMTGKLRQMWIITLISCTHFSFTIFSKVLKLLGLSHMALAINVISGWKIHVNFTTLAWIAQSITNSYRGIRSKSLSTYMFDHLFKMVNKLKISSSGSMYNLDYFLCLFSFGCKY